MKNKNSRSLRMVGIDLTPTHQLQGIKMKALNIALLIAGGLTAGSAMAQPIVVSVPPAVAATSQPLSRAEVMADLHIWRLSGMQAARYFSDYHDERNPQYQAALARYQAMRSSPDFAALVEKLRADPSASVVGR
jgi:hypothetical protein